MRLLEISKEYLFLILGNCILKVHLYNSKIDVISYDKSREDNECKVISITINEDMKYLVASYSNKLICCWDINTNELLGNSYLKKKSTSIQCALYSNTSLNRTISTKIDHHVLLVSDKTGDLYASDLPSMKKLVLITGHTASVITDMKVIDKYVITCDRDEKVRISHFPAVENIQSFCLGHVSVVSSIDTIEINNQVLVLSTGWDHKLILWEASMGSMLDSISYKDKSIETSNNIPQQSGILDSIQVPLGDSIGISSTIPDDQRIISDHEKIDMDMIDNEEEHVKIDNDVDEIDDDEDNLDNKQYNELVAGYYPLKVMTATLHINIDDKNTILNTIQIAVVMFKSLSKVIIYSIHPIDLKFKEQFSIDLEAIPVDINVKEDTKELFVILPKPYGMKVYKLLPLVVTNNTTNDILSSIVTVSIEDITMNYSKLITNILELANNIGFDFMIPELSTRNDLENGMTKHTLDKRFNSQENIGYRTKKGHKRSKRSIKE